MTTMFVHLDAAGHMAATMKRSLDMAVSHVLREGIVASWIRYSTVRSALGIGVFAALGSVSTPALACSDLANICQMNQQHHQNMMDYGRQAAESYAGWSSDQYDEPESPRAPPPPPSFPAFMAIATHVDTSAVWITRAHWKQKPAEQHVLSACNAAMGGGCTLGGSADSWGTLVVVYDAMGIPWTKAVPQIDNDYDRQQAKNVALRLCNANSFGCYQSFHFPGTFIHYDANPDADYSKDIFPNYTVRRHHWVMVARPENAPPAFKSKSWLISGKQGADAVREKILSHCRAETKSPCKITSFAANGMLAHYVNAKGENRWISASGDRMLEQRLYRACQGAEKPCRVVAKYDAVTPRLQAVEDAG
jgi:hypothetical protein